MHQAVSAPQELGWHAVPVQVHLLDGTYELFRQFFGQPPRVAQDGAEVGATRGVLQSVLRMLADGATHVGVATDHVIESFRNELWPSYKNGESVPPELKAQFGLLEDGLDALGVTVWPMVELEADDALASAAAVAAADRKVEQILLCTPDKDLAQCVVTSRVVQVDPRRGTVLDEEGVRRKFGVGPGSIPDWLALVGDAADGFSGIRGWGPKSAAVVLARYGTIDAIPDALSDWDPKVRELLRGADRLATSLATQRDLAELFRVLATLRIDRSLLSSASRLAWRGPTRRFEDVCRYLGDPALAERAAAIAALRTGGR